MGEQPLISIIVPVYNVEKYLRECLDSVCNQEKIKSEIILVDDGSTDGSGAICDEYAHEYANIKVIHQKNQGPGSARNAGLDIMTGEYVSFVDSDDYVEADMHEVMLQAIMQTESDIACCGHVWVDNGKVIAAERPVTAPAILSGRDIIRNLMLDKEMSYSPWGKLFRAESLKEVRFPKEDFPAEDMPFIYEILKRAEKVVYIGQAKYYYRLVMDSRTKKAFQHKNIYVFLYTQRNCYDVIKCMPELREEAVFAMVQCAVSVYAQLIKDGKQKECKKEKRYMEKFLRKNCCNIVGNSYLSRNAKLVALAVPIQCFGILMKLREKLKGKKY